MLLLHQIVLVLRITIVMLQEPKHCQIVSSMQDTKSCCTLGNTDISSRWSCQGPFFSLEVIQFPLYFLLTWNFFLSYDIFAIKWKASISREFNRPRKRQGAHLQSMADCCLFHKQYLNGKCPLIAYNCSKKPVSFQNITHRQHAEKSVRTPVGKIVCEV